jgi:hypothetical protein
MKGYKLPLKGASVNHVGTRAEKEQLDWKVDSEKKQDGQKKRRAEALLLALWGFRNPPLHARTGNDPERCSQLS